MPPKRSARSTPTSSYAGSSISSSGNSESTTSGSTYSRGGYCADSSASSETTFGAPSEFSIDSSRPGTPRARHNGGLPRSSVSSGSTTDSLTDDKVDNSRSRTPHTNSHVSFLPTAYIPSESESGSDTLGLRWDDTPVGRPPTRTPKGPFALGAHEFKPGEARRRKLEERERSAGFSKLSSQSVGRTTGGWKGAGDSTAGRPAEGGSTTKTPSKPAIPGRSGTTMTTTLAEKETTFAGMKVKTKKASVSVERKL